MEGAVVPDIGGGGWICLRPGAIIGVAAVAAPVTQHPGSIGVEGGIRHYAAASKIRKSVAERFVDDLHVAGDGVCFLSHGVELDLQTRTPVKKSRSRIKSGIYLCR